MWTLTFLIFFSLVLGIGAWLFFIWSVKSGYYDDIERPKHRMMDDTEDRPAPPDARQEKEDRSSR
jgi:cbb3-type cytochrome oxidase maturation protein